MYAVMTAPSIRKQLRFFVTTTHRARDYQEDLSRGIRTAWAAGNRNVVAVLPTGGGKSFVAAREVSDFQGMSCVIAHRAELVTQLSVALAREAVRHRVVGPTTLQRAITAVHMEEFNRSFVDPGARTAVASVDSLVGLDPKTPWLSQIGLWVQDECFPAGTLVDGRPIESIQAGDTVTAFDASTGALEARAVVRTFKNPMPRLMVRVTSGSRVLVATPGHPFYTTRGWVAAVHLTEDDYVLHELPDSDTRNDRVAALPASEDGAHLLHGRVRVCAPRGGPGALASPEAVDNVLYVPAPGGPFGVSPCAVERYGPGVLQQNLLDRVSSRDLVADDVSNEQAARCGSDAGEQPDALRSDAPEGIGDASTNRPSPGGSGRQRPADSRGRSDVDLVVPGARVCSPTRCSDGSAAGVGAAAFVQAGHGAPDTEDRLGSGRPEPQRQTSGVGREARPMLGWARVEGVKVLERGDTNIAGDGCVYNIEVDGLHTYFANGVVVHNCHHVLADNKWGRACALFPNAYGLGITATPTRADGKGLGRHADGVMDAMVVGPTMRELIERGFLTDYRVFAPPSDIDLSAVTTTDSGDFSPPKLREARRRSHITGDVVKHYLRIAPGKLGVTFEVDIDSATETAAAYRAAGVTAEVVSSKTPEALRRQVLRRFRSREVLQLVNVDLFGEGFDLPAIEVVSMARPTQSYSLYCQQFGRALRPLDGKTHAIIIDHVRNVERHRLPDARREWTLDRRERRARSAPDDAIPLRTCLNEECLQVYERVLPSCPFCGHTPVPADRSAPEFVDGDLLELDPSVLAALRGEADRLRGEPVYPPSAGIEVRHAIFKRHSERRVSQSELERGIALWAGWQAHLGRGLNETYRRFYHRFGTDIATAMTLGTREAYALNERIAADLQQHNVQELPNANPVA